MDTYAKVDATHFKQTKQVEITHDLARVKMEKQMAIDSKARTIAECDEIVARCDALLLEADKLGVKK
jgi:hypothetical protein